MVLGLTACGTDTGDRLEDSRWILESYGEPGSMKTVLDDTEITIEFISAEQKMSGSAGCNSYFGGYAITGDNLSIPGPIGSTLMACPEEIMDQETEYLATLQEAESYNIIENQLTITCDDRKLIYTAE